jgi:hypothetical protein
LSSLRVSLFLKLTSLLEKMSQPEGMLENGDQA